jgi:hypothetical protein
MRRRRKEMLAVARIMALLVVVLVIFAALASPALAQKGNNDNQGGNNDNQGGNNDNQGGNDDNQGGNNDPPRDAPELDPGFAMSAIVLLVFGTLLLTDRRRGNKSATKGAF